MRNSLKSKILPSLGLILLPAMLFASGMEFKGVVESRPEGVAGTWVVGGESFKADEKTRLKEEHGPIAKGSCVEVKYRKTGEEKVARKIESEKESKCKK